MCFYALEAELCRWLLPALPLSLSASLSPSLFTVPFLNCFPSRFPLWPTSLHHVTLHLLPMNVASKSVASLRRLLISRLVSQQFLSFCFCFSTYKFVIHQIEQNFKRLVQVSFWSLRSSALDWVIHQMKSIRFQFYSLMLLWVCNRILKTINK